MGIGFLTIIVVWLITFVADIIIASSPSLDNAYGSQLNKLWLFGVIWYLRSALRARQGIPGNGLEDCCTAFWCAPCAVTQMLAQMWAKPEVQPGCQCTEASAMLP